MDKKIEETREFLQTIGMPKAQQADICCYVILAMAGIKPDMSWSEATNEWIRIHDIAACPFCERKTSCIKRGVGGKSPFMRTKLYQRISGRCLCK